MNRLLLAALLVVAAVAMAAFAFFAVGTGGADALAWDTILIGLSAGLFAGASAIASAPWTGFLVGPVAAAAEGLLMLGVPGVGR